MTKSLQESMPLRTQSWNKAMAASPGELDLVVSPEQIEGEIPSSLIGTRMLSNGPGWTKIGNTIAHPFDGHGYVRAFDFLPDGSCKLTSRFVKTPSYLAEAEAGELVHRGFATNLKGGFWKNIGFGTPRNVANTTVTRWGSRLLAGWEGGSPYALDAETLETIGEEAFGGEIEGLTTLAHFKHDREQGRLILCSVKAGRETAFTFREIDREDNVVSTSEGSIPGMLFTHDFAMTPSTYILGGNPLKLKPVELMKMLVGSSTLLRSIEPNVKKPGVLHLFPRGSKGEVRTVKLPGNAYVIHFGNAFEKEGVLYVDACVFTHFEFGEEFGYTGPDSLFDPSLPEERGPQRLVRIAIPEGAEEATWETMTPYGIDFPRFHPEHEGLDTPCLFGATRKDTRFSDPFDSLIRVDLQTEGFPTQLWTTEDNVFIGEPVFAPAEKEPSTGHILAIQSDGLNERTHLLIFDAASLDKGPITRIPFPLLPIAFHGDWDSRENR